MTSKERVMQSFRHRSPDRVPLDYVAVTELSARLMERFHLRDFEALLLKLKVDFRHMDKWGNTAPKYVGPEPEIHPDGTREDYWGLRCRKVEYQPGCFYEEYVQPPLAARSALTRRHSKVIVSKKNKPRVCQEKPTRANKKKIELILQKEPYYDYSATIVRA